MTLFSLWTGRSAIAAGRMAVFLAAAILRTTIVRAPRPGRLDGVNSLRWDAPVTAHSPDCLEVAGQVDGLLRCGNHSQLRRRFSVWRLADAATLFSSLSCDVSRYSRRMKRKRHGSRVVASLNTNSFFALHVQYCGAPQPAAVQQDDSRLSR